MNGHNNDNYADDSVNYHSNNISIKIERTDDSRASFGLAKSSYLHKVKEGLLPPPVHIGGRASGFVAHENDLVKAAMIAGKTNDELKELVKSIVGAREAFYEKLSQQLLNAA